MLYRPLILHHFCWKVYIVFKLKEIENLVRKNFGRYVSETVQDKYRSTSSSKWCKVYKWIRMACAEHDVIYLMNFSSLKVNYYDIAL
jgi:hypothetical protein